MAIPIFLKCLQLRPYPLHFVFEPIDKGMHRGVVLTRLYPDLSYHFVYCSGSDFKLGDPSFRLSQAVLSYRPGSDERHRSCAKGDPIEPDPFQHTRILLGDFVFDHEPLALELRTLDNVLRHGQNGRAIKLSTSVVERQIQRLF